jgi:hypothetical protein
MASDIDIVWTHQYACDPRMGAVATGWRFSGTRTQYLRISNGEWVDNNDVAGWVTPEKLKECVARNPNNFPNFRTICEPGLAFDEMLDAANPCKAAEPTLQADPERLTRGEFLTLIVAVKSDMYPKAVYPDDEKSWAKWLVERATDLEALLLPHLKGRRP